LAEASIRHRRGPACSAQGQSLTATWGTVNAQSDDTTQRGNGPPTALIGDKWRRNDGPHQGSIWPRNLGKIIDQARIEYLERGLVEPLDVDVDAVEPLARDSQCARSPLSGVKSRAMSPYVDPVRQPEMPPDRASGAQVAHVYGAGR
jgi:hypothetical protein